MPTVTLVTTCDMRNGIDSPMGVPWTIPESEVCLEILTKGAICIVDADTWQTLSPTLKDGDREFIVWSKTGASLSDGTPTYMVSQIRAMIRFGHTKKDPKRFDIFVFGSDHLYSCFMSYATFIRMVRVMDYYEECDKVFPKIDDLTWRVSRISAQRLSQDDTPYRMLTFFRIKDACPL